MSSFGGEEEEEAPLLGPKQDNAHIDPHQRRVIIMNFIMVILVDFAAYFLFAPQTSILEDIICSHHYNSVAGEQDCTVGPVQAELATINQMLNTFNRLPGLFVAIPYGMMADRYGRRPVLILSIVGALLQDVVSKIILWRPDLFSPRMVWVSSTTLFVGGGDAVAGSMIFLVIADVAPPNQRANLFFLLTACGLVGEVVATPLSALPMSKNPWIPYFIYTLLTLLGGIIPLFLLPETLRRSSLETKTPPEYTSADEVRPAAADETLSKSTPSTVFPGFRPLVKHNVIALLLAYFVSALGRQSTGFLLQYIRQRFNWKYEKASILITLRASINLALLLVGLPALNKFLVMRGMSAPGKDLLISRTSVAFFAMGSLVIAAAPSAILATLGIVIFALGSGFAPATRSLVTTFCHQDEAGLLYSSMAIAQTIGGLIAGPLLTLSFRWGLSLGHEWTGIPFALVAGLFGCGFLAVSFVRL